MIQSGVLWRNGIARCRYGTSFPHSLGRKRVPLSFTLLGQLSGNTAARNLEGPGSGGEIFPSHAPLVAAVAYSEPRQAIALGAFSFAVLQQMRTNYSAYAQCKLAPIARLARDTSNRSNKLWE
jgi:hypothetical protein